MNRKDFELCYQSGEHSSGSESTIDVSSEEPASSTTAESKGTPGLGFLEDGMKRAAVKERIENYFYQLTDGCGKDKCDNEYCASSGKLQNLSPNAAAGMALKLWKSEAKLCDPHPAKIPRTEQTSCNTSNTENPKSSLEKKNIQVSEGKPLETSTSASSRNSNVFQPESEKNVLTEKKLYTIIEDCKSMNNYTRLRSVLFEVFSKEEFLAASFKKAASLDKLKENIPEHVLTSMSKETMESCILKPPQAPLPDLASSQSSSNNLPRRDFVHTADSSTDLDIESLRRAFDQLFSLPCVEFESTLVQALVSLSECINIFLRCGSKVHQCYESFINIFIIIFEIPSLGGCDYVERALPKICKTVAQLPPIVHARIAQIWAKHCKQRLKNILEALQQLITIKCISVTYDKEFIVQDDESLISATKVMKILFYANILAGDLETMSVRSLLQPLEDSDPEDSSFESMINNFTSRKFFHEEDPLATVLKVNILDCRKPFIPFIEFYNEPLSEVIEMDQDYGFFRTQEQLRYMKECSMENKFSFLYYSFILTPAAKSLGLYYDSRTRMHSERAFSIFHSASGRPMNPYLRLKVRRDHIIEDALVELEMIAMDNVKDLKKQLVVEFEGELGIDEGGVSKEFFQLIVEEIFNPDYSMFCFDSDTQNVWFNRMSYETDAQFTLIGIVLGLAIYNNINLDVNFPMVVYKKLMGKPGTFYDLEDFNPVLFNGLRNLLEYNDDDISEVFDQTFCVCYKDAFGCVATHDLKPDGGDILVTQENKQEFVDLYADFLLNSSIEKQFKAFRRGFQLVTKESLLNFLFRPEEVEQLVCGSKIFDLSELEEAMEYDAGYTADTPVIRYFWEIAHAMTQEQQKKLLQFTTGSDRIPVGGLSKLKMFIARIGPDSDRLPTAHTCFNVLLLPEYNSKEKLYDRLMKAITYSKGFGML